MDAILLTHNWWVMWVNVLACLPQDKVAVAFPQCLHMVSLFLLETSSRTEIPAVKQVLVFSLTSV